MSQPILELPAVLRFQPVYENSAPGGPWLIESLGRPRLLAPSASASLEFSTNPDTPSRVAEGPLAGRTWAELMEGQGERVGGSRAAELAAQGLDLEIAFRAADVADSPLLLVAPLPAGTVSAVVTVEARPEAKIYGGRRRDLPEDQFLRLLKTSPPREILQGTPAAPGQVILAPGGFPYALGQGVLVYEARIAARKSGASETGRRSGRHPDPGLITAAVPASRLAVQGLGYIEGRNAVTWLDASEWLASVRLDLRAEWVQERPPDSAAGLIVLTGLHGRALLIAEASTEPLSRGQTLIVTAACPRFRINPAADGAVILQTWLPDFPADIERPLRSRGISAREIEGLFGFFGRK